MLLLASANDGALTFSNQKAFYPGNWCYAFKDENGEPTKPEIQHDAQEFFTTLCNRLETQIKAASQSGEEPVVNGLLKGEYTQQLLTLDGKQLRPNQNQPFYTVSLEVPDNGGSLENALAAMCRGEALSDFRDTSGNIVPCVKRDCLSKVNQVCVFHLKRFELNYVTFQRVKKNSKFTFPMKINLYPYTLDGLSVEEAKSKT